MNISMKLARAFVALAGAVTVAPIRADEHGRDRGRHEQARPWQGEIHRFHERDLGVWRGGRWHQGRHLGRSGWWWVVGPTWYFYPAPVYPYPDPYQPPLVAAPAPVTPEYWYYCNNPQGYYPYVPQCVSGWQRVPATAR